MNLRILYSIATDFKTVGPFELDWETQQYKCWISQYITFPLLAMLQALNLFWLFVIMRIAYNIAFKNVKRDVRDDDEDEDEEEEEEEEEEERECGVHELHATNDRAKETTAVSTGVQAVQQ